MTTKKASKQGRNGGSSPASGSRILRRMATQVGEMFCVSPMTNERLGIWHVTGNGIYLGTPDKSEIWLLETLMTESSEIEMEQAKLDGDEDRESTFEKLERVQKSWDSDSRIFAGALQLLKEAGLAPNSTALIAAAERAEADSGNR